jgi:hypothetical protein
MTTTIVLWTPESLTDEQAQLINDKATQMQTEG